MDYNLVYRYFSLNIWGNLPSQFQRFISKVYANLYNKHFSKYIIKPYCKFNYTDPHYLDQFRSASGSNNYSSFQDFFTRVYKTLPVFSSDFIWPCEGLLCDYGKVIDLPAINVKGDVRTIKTIFGAMGNEIDDGYYFSNVFLHNNNYHRIHSPVAATVIEIKHIHGDLVLLRPWLYKNDPSLPALRNERVNIKLKDNTGRLWYLSIVGGPAVGTIVLNADTIIGSQLMLGQEIGKFLLGSTCCIAAPIPSQKVLTGQQVLMGQDY
ncbi:phosphatidylserine decarboxylase [Fulvivirga sp. M361]|uniref:phosphatidylserine decarboxylase n=1 Tax=Fulvivirga sp. M361 TaxID=2594266 RepID=UPI00117BD72E|nr:phosphatidylserine decarboxylase [Fulvivirga sp. M361]TRX59579.1 phosphatidylserine decarboxylase [Fulvivirga sp. M361]